MKTATKILMLTAVVSYLIFAVATLSHGNDDKICSGIKIVLSDTTETSYMPDAYISNIITEKKIFPEGKKLSQININDIETAVRSNPYVDSVICYYTPTGTICVKVIPVKPIIHIIADNGQQYYMDVKGKVLPSSDFDLDLCLATGNITPKTARTTLLSLAEFLNTHSPWDKEIQQVNVIDENHISLTAVTGNHSIMLGPTTNLEDKFERLAIFYKEGLDKVGWNKYKEINLSFADQVVCTRTEPNKKR